MSKRQVFEEKYNKGFKCELKTKNVRNFIKPESKEIFDKKCEEYQKLLEPYGLDESYMNTLLVLASNNESYRIMFNPNEIVDKLYGLFNLGSNEIYRPFEYKEIFDRETYRTLLYAIENFDRFVNTEEKLEKKYPFLYFEYIKFKQKYPALDVSTFIDYRLSQIRLLIKDFDKILTYAAENDDLLAKTTCDYESLRLYAYDKFLDKLETGKGQKKERHSLHVLLGRMKRDYEDDKTIIMIDGDENITYEKLISRLNVLSKKNTKCRTVKTEEKILPSSIGKPTGIPVGKAIPLTEEEFERLKKINTEKKNFYASLNPDEYLVNDKFLNNGYEAFIFNNGVVILDRVIKDDKHIRSTIGNAIYVTDVNMLMNLTSIDKKTLKQMGVRTINHTDTYKERVEKEISKGYMDEEYTKEKIDEYKETQKK